VTVGSEGRVTAGIVGKVRPGIDGKVRPGIVGKVGSLITGAAVTPRAAVARTMMVVNCMLIDGWSEKDQEWIVCLSWWCWYRWLLLWCRDSENRALSGRIYILCLDRLDSGS
jgi:hypothetical protein